MNEYKCLLFKKEWYGQGLYITYHLNGKIYKVPHDKLVDAIPILNGNDIRLTKSWEQNGHYSWTDYNVPLSILEALERYRIK